MKNELLPSHPLELSEKNVSILSVTFFLSSARKIEGGFKFTLEDLWDSILGTEEGTAGRGDRQIPGAHWPAQLNL